MTINPQPYIDMILETENLTDGLESAEAEWLLNWGVDQIKVLLEPVGDSDAAGQKTENLMVVLRTINNIVADREYMPPETMAENMQTLAERYHQAFGKAHQLELPMYVPVAKELAKKSPLEAVQSLVELITP